VALLALALGALGLGLGFSAASDQLPGGDLSRLVLFYVPALWLAVLLFVTLAAWAALGLLWRNRLACMMAHALAPTGGMFAFLTLWVGAMWSKGLGHGWWTGDPRQVAGLLLLMIYIAIVGLPVVVTDVARADRAIMVLAVAGLVGEPLLFFAVQAWSGTRTSTPIPDGPLPGGPLLAAGVVL
jgi:heme exporter protein C